jgi:hypothetical protein
MQYFIGSFASYFFICIPYMQAYFIEALLGVNMRFSAMCKHARNMQKNIAKELDPICITYV